MCLSGDKTLSRDDNSCETDSTLLDMSRDFYITPNVKNFWNSFVGSKKCKGLAENEDESEYKVSMVECLRLVRTGICLAGVGYDDWEEGGSTLGYEGYDRWWSAHENGDENCCTMGKKDMSGEREESDDSDGDVVNE